MNRTDRKTFLNALLNVVLVLTIVWTSADLFKVDGLLRDEITANLAVYTISRALNAAISLVQSAEINLIVGNVDIGELLDPVNDAIERFSTVLTWATTSLLVQKFVITLVGSTGYKMIATGAAGIYLVAVSIGRVSGGLAAMAKAAFEFLGWITLATVISIWFSISVSSEWVGDSLRNAERDLQAFRLEATQLEGLITGTFDADIETSKALEEQRASVSRAVQAAQARFAAIEAEITRLEGLREAARPERSWMDRVRRPFGGEDPPEIQSLDAALLTAEQQREIIEVEIENLLSNLACLDKQLAGGTCEGVMGRLSAFTEGVSVLAGKSPELIVSMLDVMAAVIFKNLLAPLLLAYVILKFGPGWIARRTNPRAPGSPQNNPQPSTPQISDRS
jgi:hypothetical protein